MEIQKKRSKANSVGGIKYIYRSEQMLFPLEKKRYLEREVEM
jgi:hypothetical protein